MAIRCIAFDLDDTLWECHSVIARAEQWLYNALHNHCPAITQQYSYEALVADRSRFTQAHPELQYDLSTLRLNWLQQLLQTYNCNQDGLADTLFHGFWLERNKVTLFPHVLTSLEALRPHYQLGVITNGNADVQHIGIGYLFNFTLSSAQAGAAKPDASIFRQALALADVAADEMVYVGDDPEKDIIGANQAGLRSIWFNPQQVSADSGVNPDAVLTNFAELERLIQLL